MPGKVANVFVIIDVQNCFMAGGSFGGPSKMESLITEIKDIYDTVKPEYVVVTRDVHPSHHASHQFTGSKPGTTLALTKTGEVIELPEQAAFFMSAGIAPNPEGYTFPGGSYPAHCRATTEEVTQMTTCAPRTVGAATESSIWDPEKERTRPNRATNSKGKPIIGTKLSHFFGKNNEEFAAFLENPNYKLSIEDVKGNEIKHPKDVKYQFAVSNPVKEGTPPVLELLKGQLCKWDALSAFQYHANFDETLGGSPGGTDVPGDLNHTTCLAEILCSTNYGLADQGYEKINIIACGLVGEICVKATVAYGMHTFISAKKGSGLLGYPRIVPKGCEAPVAGTIPKIHFTYSTYGTRFVPISDAIKGIRTFINTRIAEAGGQREDVTHTLWLKEDKVILPGSADPSTWGDVDAITKQKLRALMLSAVNGMTGGRRTRRNRNNRGKRTTRKNRGTRRNRKN